METPIQRYIRENNFTNFQNDIMMTSNKNSTSIKSEERESQLERESYSQQNSQQQQQEKQPSTSKKASSSQSPKSSVHYISTNTIPVNSIIVEEESIEQNDNQEVQRLHTNNDKNSERQTILYNEESIIKASNNNSISINHDSSVGADDQALIIERGNTTNKDFTDENKGKSKKQPQPHSKRTPTFSPCNKVSPEKTKNSLKVGEELLDKISGLIVEIEKKSKHGKIVEGAKSETRHKSITEGSINHSRRSAGYESPNKTVLSLYQLHHQRSVKAQNIETVKLYREMTDLKSFKVENEVSKFLNERNSNSRKPFLERSSMFEIKKKEAIMAKQAEIVEEEARKEQIEFEYVQEAQKRLQEKYEKNLEKKKKAGKPGNQTSRSVFEELQKREMEKQRTKRYLHFEEIKERAKDTYKPQISTTSKKIFEKIVEKKDLSNSFVERSEQYTYVKKIKTEEDYKLLQSEYCPFTPKISDASKKLAAKTRNQSKTTKNKETVEAENSPKYTTHVISEKNDNNMYYTQRALSLKEASKGKAHKYNYPSTSRNSKGYTIPAFLSARSQSASRPQWK